MNEYNLPIYPPRKTCCSLLWQQNFNPYDYMYQGVKNVYTLVHQFILHTRNYII